jgi:hypothetical protein
LFMAYDRAATVIGSVAYFLLVAVYYEGEKIKKHKMDGSCNT